MDYIAGQPLNQKVTLYTKSNYTNEYGEPTGYAVAVLNCAIFEGQKKTLNRDGEEVLSSARVAVINKPSINSMLFIGESTDFTPPATSQEVISVSTIRDEWQDIVGYWIWL